MKQTFVDQRSHVINVMKDLLSIDVLETFPRRGGKPFAQKDLAGCPNFYERVGKRGGPYYNNVGRTGI